MTATETETMTEEQLEDFKGRWSALREENQKLAAKVRDNEQQMLKLQGNRNAGVPRTEYG